MANTYRDDVTAAIHETATGLHGIGVIDKPTMREFDELCLTPTRPLTGEELRVIRERQEAETAELQES